jgi:hypothetical protein
VRCDYCGRTNCDDGHGGCFACGAPITRWVENGERYAISGRHTMTCVTGFTDYRQTEISRKKVTIG